MDSKWYFTGKPCKKGHIAPRLKSNRSCKVCAYEKRAAYENSEAYTKWKDENRKNVCSKWQQNNKDIANANTRKYQASKLKRTPIWLSEEQITDLQSFYTMAKELETVFPWKQHVDHIVPLQGKTISGLHVPWNLQIISAKENISKGNRY
jgi:ribosomal protein L3